MADYIAPSAKTQRLVTVAAWGTDYWAKAEGGEISGDATEVWDGGAEQPDYIGGRAMTSNLTVTKPYRPGRDAARLREMARQVMKLRTTVTLQENKPITPFNLVAFSIDEGIQLEWGQTIYDDMKSQVLYRRSGGEKPLAIITLPPDTLEFLDQNVKPGKQYFYSLTTKNDLGIESEPSDEIEVAR